ncbi:DEAD/DEAH box helicase [Cesiribacter sp. SM1]|uniref:DEAD/DEAH box helicase n=1 Tax=Cesiribacter sp. SM1 TaxID=2861196 RepID=UPI001CD1B564|nr:DEAD/DEAH box helicase [Cesiribacter sp. SM1]
MKVSISKPFKLIYSLYAHEYLGYLFESFVVQLDDAGQLSFLHQNISYKNAAEFASGLDEKDYELIRIMDSMQQDVVIKQFWNKKVNPSEFFLKVYDQEKGNRPVQEEIERYLEHRRAQILERMQGKLLFEMGNDGEPAWRQIQVMPQQATVLFHFRRNEVSTHYFPTIKYGGQKLDFQRRGAYLVCKDPAWLVLNNRLYTFEQEVDGKKLQPFLQKQFIEVPRKVEDTYYRRFVAPLISQFDVLAVGFEIKEETYSPQPVLTFSELAEAQTAELMLYDGNGAHSSGDTVATAGGNSGKILFNLSFRYGTYLFKADTNSDTSVRVEQQGSEYIFHKVKRHTSDEKRILKLLRDTGLDIRHARTTLPKQQAFSWLNTYRRQLEELGFSIGQNEADGKRYFLGESSIIIEVRENIDWFDIYAVIRFGPYEITFQELRRHIMRRQTEIKLPNGEVAVIPEQWFLDYSELFAFAEDNREQENMVLRKHHLALVQDLQNGNLAQVTMSRKLEMLRNFEEIEDHPVPIKFQGQLRPYQKAGYNWLQFLNKYGFGGCLADDMGLGKTIQTLAMLQAQKELGQEGTSLLVMPTSLIYNWEMEAKRFTPNLRVHLYTGTGRNKDVSRFKNYDLVLSSYGIVRLDIEELQKFYFNYVILDESQAIKNPGSNIAKAVRELKSRRRLILTGTPLENSTMDLWSQMHFINPGLLGNQTFFRNEFLNPIEKKQDETKTGKLYSIIKPFILRRQKTQVATELPDKVENIRYCSMTEEQAEKYEAAKNYYRSHILDQIDLHGVKKSQFVLLQGLTKLRQIANHPYMVDEEYKDSSGKMEEVLDMLQNAIAEGHKILVFSQFVKHLTLVRKYLDAEKIPYAYLDGATKDRQGQVERFQNDPKLRIFLISLKAGGVGLNLTKADYVFMLDPWWNPAIEQQAIDRAHRIGQENRVFTYKFITKDTVEEKILALQQHKTSLADNLITTEESFVKTLSKEDIDNILA